MPRHRTPPAGEEMTRDPAFSCSVKILAATAGPFKVLKRRWGGIRRKSVCDTTSEQAMTVMAVTVPRLTGTRLDPEIMYADLVPLCMEVLALRVLPFV